MRLLMILAIVLTACGAAPEPTPAAQTITGVVALHAQSGVFADACAGGGGYSDIKHGMGLTLRDGEGNVIGTSQLEGGQASDDRTLCQFAFTFEDVPTTDFYVVETGRRGELTYSRAEMESNDWTVGMEIGN